MSEAELERIHTDAFGSAGPAPVWFHGKVDRKKLEAKMTGLPDGTFVIRDSSSSFGNFVLTVSEGGRVSHYKIDRLGDQNFCIGEQYFKDMPEIIEFYKRHLLDTTTLSVPLPLDEAVQGAKLVNNYKFKVTALFNFNAKDPEDLSFRKGDVLNVLDMHEDAWWRAQSTKTLQIGCIPVNYLEIPPEVRATLRVDAIPPPPVAVEPQANYENVSDAQEPEPVQQEAPPPPPPTRRAAPAPPPVEEKKPEPAPAPPVQKELPERVPSFSKFLKQDAVLEPERPKFLVAEALMDRAASAYDPSALSFKRGDTIHIIKQHDNGLWEGSIIGGNGKIGHFPFTLVELIDCGFYDDEIAALEVAFNAEMDEIYGTR